MDVFGKEESFSSEQMLTFLYLCTQVDFALQIINTADHALSFSNKIYGRHLYYVLAHHLGA